MLTNKAKTDPIASMIPWIDPMESNLCGSAWAIVEIALPCPTGVFFVLCLLDLIGLFCVGSTFPFFAVGQGTREEKDKILASCWQIWVSAGIQTGVWHAPSRPSICSTGPMADFNNAKSACGQNSSNPLCFMGPKIFLECVQLERHVADIPNPISLPMTSHCTLLIKHDKTMTFPLWSGWR